MNCVNSSFGTYSLHKNYENENALFWKFAQNPQLMKICTNYQIERKERPKGFLNRLKICPEPPKPPPRPPNRFEIVLKRIHSEGVMAAREIISASVASIVSVAATQPFDVLKVKYLMSPTRSKAPWYKVFQFRLLHVIRIILATKGYERFYKGHFEAQRESLFQTISMFYTYHRVYQELENFERFKTYPDLCIFFSGFASASISVLLLRPYAAFQDQLTRKRQLLQKFGPIRSAYNVKQKVKWISAFKGCFADFLFTGTQNGLRFLAYTKITNELLSRKPDEVKHVDEYFRSDDSANSDFEPKKAVKSLTSSEALLAGAISGILSDFVTHPLDVINTRLKTPALARQLYKFDDNCRYFGQCAKIIWKKNKLRGFYNGLFPVLMKSGISTAVTFAVYDAIQDWLQLFLSE